MKRLYYRLRILLYRRRLEQDLHDELDSHLKMDALEGIQAGALPEDAGRSARRDFGNILRSAEDVRETWGMAGIDRLTQDVRYAFRQMKRNRGFVVMAIFSLGLGI